MSRVTSASEVDMFAAEIGDGEQEIQAHPAAFWPHLSTMYQNASPKLLLAAHEDIDPGEFEIPSMHTEDDYIKAYLISNPAGSISGGATFVIHAMDTCAISAVI
eukprot:5303789-Amphidinium_carterae.1